MSDPQPADAAPADQALHDAIVAVLRPLARLAVERGMNYGALDEALKRALVDVARETHQRNGGPASRLVSRISTTTGINRREVTRLTRGESEAPRESRSRSSVVFAHWRSHPDFLDADGLPRVLPRQGPHPSFESLTRGITQDVHPRSVLDELVRLKLAVHDEVCDTVELARDDFVPVGDSGRMLGFLGANVGDHLAAAVDNVCSPTPRHLERAVFAERFSAESIAIAERWLGGHWSQLHAQLVPLLENLLAADEADPARVRDRRLRAGLYVYAAPVAASAEGEPGAERDDAAPAAASRDAEGASPAAPSPAPLPAVPVADPATAAYGIVQSARERAARSLGAAAVIPVVPRPGGTSRR